MTHLIALSRLLLAIVGATQLPKSDRPSDMPPVRITRVEAHLPPYMSAASIIERSGLRVGDTISDRSLEEARRRLWFDGAFDSRDPGSQLRISVKRAGESAVVVIEVTDSFSLTGLDISGSEPLAEARIRQAIALKPGRPVTRAQIREAVGRVQALYDRAGYIAAVTGSDIGDDGILHLTISLLQVRSVSLVGIEQPETWLSRLGTKAGQYVNTHSIAHDRALLTRHGLIVEDDALVVITHTGFARIEWHVFRHVTRDQSAVLNAALQDVIGDSTGTTVLDTNELKGFKPEVQGVVPGDFAKIAAEFKRIEKRPDYLVELQFTNWRSALRRAYPRADHYVIAKVPKVGADIAVVSLILGPPDSVHGPRYLTVCLYRHGERWIVQH